MVLHKDRYGYELQCLDYSYDSLARPIALTERRRESTYTTLVEYDGISRPVRVVYPSAFAVRYGYSHGRMRTVSDDGGKTLWRTDSVNACGQPLSVRQGHNLVTQNTYDPTRGTLTETKTRKGDAFLQHFRYTYDNFGNLASRKDVSHNMEETFAYDDIDRLTEVCLGTMPTGTMAYDAYGRMTAKTADGCAVFSNATYSLTAKPHAIDKAVTPTGVFPSTPQAITYTGFDKVLKVKQGNDSLVYTYGHDRQRIAMEEHVGNTTRTKRYVGACEYVTETSGNVTVSKKLTYLHGPGGVFAVVERRNGVDMLHYVLKDNLGSWTTITDEDGNVEQRLSYDAWGNLRDPATWRGSFTGTPIFDRGFTGHEHLYNFGLINMNGRMYDPVMSSFLSVDRYVQDPSNAQGFNRYAYCMYNPLRYVDPTGWYAGVGNGSSPDDPPHYVVIGDGSGVLLSEVTITASPLNNGTNTTFNEFEYNPNTEGGGGVGSQWGMPNNGSTSGTGGGGSANHGGNHGGKPVFDKLEETPPDGVIIHTGSFLLMKAYWHYQFGRKKDFWVDASTLDLDYITQDDLSFYKDGRASINLFDYSKTAQSALTLGKIDLIPIGDNMFRIADDYYNFEIEWDKGWTNRNMGTAISGYLHGPVFDDVPLPTHWMDGKPCYAQPSVYFGGPYNIRFIHSVYIKP